MRLASMAVLVSLSLGCNTDKGKKGPPPDDEPSSTTPASSSSSGATAPSTTSSAASAPPPVVVAGEDAFVAKHLQLLAGAGACKEGSKIRAFCALTKFAQAKAIPPPPAASSHIGLSTFVTTEGATEESIAQRVEVSALAFNPDGGGRALLSTVKPDNDSERADLLAARTSIEAFAVGGPTPKLGNNLATYLESLPKRAKYTMTPHSRGFRLDGGSKADVRFVGSAWVVVEVPARDPKGAWMSVYPK